MSTASTIAALPELVFEQGASNLKPTGYYSWEDTSNLPRMDPESELENSSLNQIILDDLNMSSTFEGAWPWTKGLPFAVADPIEPLDEHDDRPSIKALLQKQQDKIDVMKNGLADDPLYEPKKHDDLWLLRFLLSHKKKVKPAMEAAKFTLAFRHKHQLDNADLRHLQPAGKDSFIEAVRLLAEHIQPQAMAYTVPDTQRGVVTFWEMAGIDTDKIVQEYDEHPHWFNFQMYLSEWMFQWNDYVSRKTGRLTKSISIANVKDIGVWNKEYQKRNERASAAYELCYPQNVAGYAIVNAPKWIYTVWSSLRFFLPKRVVEKVDFIDPLKNPMDKSKLLKYMSDDKLPDRFGGSYKAWPVEYPIPDEGRQRTEAMQLPSEETNDKKGEAEEPLTQSGTDMNAQNSEMCMSKMEESMEGCEGMKMEKAPQKARWWKRKRETGQRTNIFKRRKNRKEEEGQGNMIRGERREFSASTTYFSAPFLAIDE